MTPSDSSVFHFHRSSSVRDGVVRLSERLPIALFSVLSASRVRRTCAVWLLVVAAGAPVAAQTPRRPRTPWWKDPAIQLTLELTPAQIDALQEAFLENADERIALRRKLDRLDTRLHHLIDLAEEDDATILALSDRVEDVRARRNVARALMLLAMRRILTPEQRVRLRNLHDGGGGK